MFSFLKINHTVVKVRQRTSQKSVDARQHTSIKMVAGKKAPLKYQSAR